MHAQLPYTIMFPAQTSAPSERGVELDRLILNRPGRKVKFYFRKNRCKRCYSDLSDEQVKALFTALQKIGKTKSGSLVFDDDLYLISPATRKYIA